MSDPQRAVRPQLVVFDMAGTTVHDAHFVHQALMDALAAAGVSITVQAANAVMGWPKPVAIATLTQNQTGQAPSPQWVEAVHQDFQRRMVLFYATHPEVREIPGAVQTFRQLRQAGIQVYLDTGFDRSIVEAILTRLAWHSEIDGSVASDEVAKGRPAPDLAFKAMQLAGVQHPTEVAKVGDTPSDLQEGTAAGCGWVVGVTEGSHTAAQLQEFPHTHLVPNLTHLPALWQL